MEPLSLASLVVGVALLFLGRRLFWLFVGGIGFLAGVKYGAQWMSDAEAWAALGVALLAGIIGALLAVFLQKLAAAFAGLLAGGYLAHLVAASFGHEPSSSVAFLIGGLIGAVLMLVLFDWGLVVLSVMVGAAVVVDALSISQPLAGISFLGLAVLGALVQARQLVHARHRAEEKPA